MEKLRLIEYRNFELLNSTTLGQEVWQKEYYDCLERHLENLDADSRREDTEMARRMLQTELQYFHNNPGKCVSVYYVLQKRSKPNSGE